MKSRKEITFQVPWGHVAAIAWGNEENEPVLMVHGRLDNAGSFNRLIPYLPDNFYYVAIDLPSHGRSSHFPPGMFLDFFNFMLTIRYVLDELKWEKCLYLGHSLGGIVGVMFAVFLPGRLEKVIAIDAMLNQAYSPSEAVERLKLVTNLTLSSLEEKEPPLYTKEQVIDAIMNKRRMKMTREAAEALFDRAVTKVGDDKYKYNRDFRMRTHLGLCISEEQNLEFLKNLTTPVLHIVASNSWYATVNKNHILESYKKNSPPCLSFVVAEGNHDLHNNNPENVAPHVIAFFTNGDNKSKL